MNPSSNWFTEPIFDFEYQKYRLLGYLKTKDEELSLKKIFPHLDELADYKSILEKFTQRKKLLDDGFKKELIGFDLKTGLPKFEIKMDESELEEWMKIILYSQIKIEECHSRFASESEEIQKEISMELLGLLPSYLQEGFLMIRRSKEILVFRYRMNQMINSQGEKTFHYQYLEKHVGSLVRTEETIKKDLIKKINDLPIPVFFHVNTTRDYPIYETVLPFAEKQLLKWIA